MTTVKPHSVEAARRSFLQTQILMTILVVSCCFAASISTGISAAVTISAVIAAAGAALTLVTAFATNRQLFDPAGALGWQLLAMGAKFFILLGAVILAVIYQLPDTVIGLGLIGLILTHALAVAIGSIRAKVFTVDSVESATS